MWWVVIFEDAPGMQAAREQHEAEHSPTFVRIERGPSRRRAARRPESPFGGGLWVLAPVQRERAVQPGERDPYFLATRRPYRLLQWGKALRDVDVML